MSTCLPLSSPSSQTHKIYFFFEPFPLKIGGKSAKSIRVSIHQNPLSYIPFGFGEKYPDSRPVKALLNFWKSKQVCDETLTLHECSIPSIYFMTESSNERGHLLMRIHITASCLISKKQKTLKIEKEFELPDLDGQESGRIYLSSDCDLDFSAFFSNGSLKHKLPSELIELETTQIPMETEKTDENEQRDFNLERYFHSMRDFTDSNT